jgi:hypothetical protein
MTFTLEIPGATSDGTAQAEHGHAVQPGRMGFRRWEETSAPSPAS